MNPSPDQLRSLLARRQAFVADQTQSLARKIHDDISQKLTVLALQLSLDASGPEAPADWAQKCHDWSSLVIELCHAAREVNDELQPRLLDELGLTAALEWLVRTKGTDIRVTFSRPTEEMPLSSGVAAELFTICRELLSDFYPRIGAGHVRIEAEQSDGLVWLHFRGDDNGFGRRADPERDLDIISLHERVQRQGGAIQLASAPGSGTSIIVSFAAPAFGMAESQVDSNNYLATASHY